MDELFEVVTDAATLALFHPDDLAHRATDPIGWYGNEAAYRTESAAGRLVAFITAADGGFTARLTTRPDLTEQEAEFGCAPWVFPLVVRHGRVLLDNTDALPAKAAWHPDPTDLTWVHLDNGAYRVTVHPIDRTEAPDEQAATLPDYVIVLERTTNIDGITVAAGPPDLRPQRDWRQVPALRAWENGYLWTQTKSHKTRFPALQVPDALAVLPLQSTPWLDLDAEIGVAVHRLRDHDPTPMYAVAPAFRVGDLVTIARQTHGSASTWPADAKVGLTITGLGVARVVNEPRPEPLAPVEVQLVDKPDMSAPQQAIESLQRRVLERADADAAFLSHCERRADILANLADIQSPEAVTTWMLWHLEMPFAARLSCYASPLVRRAETLESFVR